MKTIILFLLYLSNNLSANEPIIVYGSLIPKSAYNESSSISILSSKNIENSQSNHLEDLIKVIPNVNYSSGSSRGKYFQIRGIGERASYEGMPNHSIGLIIDDIDYSA